ncbi:unnamed protein product [Didymodactylos carnosus]|uniref:Uncharacterized protein n=1 Tax=Didymodactylos carnosus TaxID=1234261 RepID=A0A814XMR2_9BILA|nr:unnamed protein product [Didymodactylos carnosus]CAF1216371.1 unnamed protein product [Didymodactylos carnosus]CAF3702497.1 unnamed protein product [Didymodactylos carnosus]CAF3980143.1 unnamed protein product [Didymodactylos carnosus]
MLVTSFTALKTKGWWWNYCGRRACRVSLFTVLLGASVLIKHRDKRPGERISTVLDSGTAVGLLNHIKEMKTVIIISDEGDTLLSKLGKFNVIDTSKGAENNWVLTQCFDGFDHFVRVTGVSPINIPLSNVSICVATTGERYGGVIEELLKEKGTTAREILYEYGVKTG